MEPTLKHDTYSINNGEVGKGLFSHGQNRFKLISIRLNVIGQLGVGKASFTLRDMQLSGRLFQLTAGNK